MDSEGTKTAGAQCPARKTQLAVGNSVVEGMGTIGFGLIGAKFSEISKVPFSSSFGSRRHRHALGGGGPKHDAMTITFSESHPFLTNRTDPCSPELEQSVHVYIVGIPSGKKNR